MKKSILLILIALTLLMIGSCAEDRKNYLCRSWKTDESAMLEELENTFQSDDSKSQIRAEEKIALRMRLFKKTTIRFYENGTYEQRIDTNVQKGKWAFSQDQQFILKSIENMGEQKLKIIELSESRLIIRYNEKFENLNLYWIPEE